MTFLTIDNITLVLAIWGAVLSTYKILSDYRKSTRNLKVTVSYGFGVGEGEVGPNVLLLSAINVGHRDITLSSMGYILPDKRFLLLFKPQSNVRFPYRLSEGNEVSVWQTQKQFAIELKGYGFSGKNKLKGYYKSATGKIYKSKTFIFDTETVED